MKVILQILKHYKVFSFFFVLICAITVTVVVYFYEAVQLDLKLMQEIELLHKYQNNLLNIPPNWEVVANSECTKDISFGFSFSSNCFLCRQVYVYTTLNGLDFCVTQKISVSLSTINIIILLTSYIVIIACAILFYYVLLAYLYSGIWKRIAIIQSATNDNNVSKKHSGACRYLIQVVEKTKNSVLENKIHREFSEIFDSLKQNIIQIKDQKKIPEYCIQEFEEFITKI